MTANFIGAGFLLYYDKIKKFKLESFILMSAIYASIRFCIEFIRESYPRYFGLSLAQYFSFFLILIAIFLIMKFRNEAKTLKESLTKSELKPQKIFSKKKNKKKNKK